MSDEQRTELQQVRVGDIFRSTKTQNTYKVTDIGVHTETGEELVVYKHAEWFVQWSMFLTLPTRTTHIRPMSMFAGKRSSGLWYFTPVDFITGKDI